MTKTPLFDAALDKILADLKPHTRVCTETGESFEITARDIEMLKLLRVPPPTKVWWVYIRRMRTYMAGIDLFRRTMPGGENVISMYDAESSALIVPTAYWHSDSFDPMQFGMKLDPARPFFETWKELSDSVPRPAIIQDPKSVNSEWSVYSIAYKNCYQCGTGAENEDCLYADMGWKDKHCSGITSCTGCEWCIDCVLCQNCSRAVSCEGCESCTDVTFCLACKNCTDCFGCTNLRNKKFCFFNEQLTEEEYRKRLADIDLSDSRIFEEWKTRILNTVWKTAFRRTGSQLRSENVFGDDIADCRDVVGITLFNSERLYYGFGVLRGKDSMYFSSGVDIERCFMTARTDKAYQNRMTNSCENCIDVEYSELLTSCENCFGCIGLRHKKFCIFNTQYTEEEYWPLVDAIKTAMLERGEYGDFFPYVLAPFAYNTSMADLLYPMEKTDALALGSRWYEFSEEMKTAASPVSEVPHRLAATTDDILNKKFRCSVTGRAFAYVRPEIDLYRELGVALPRVHPNHLRAQRARQMHPSILHRRTCDVCGKMVMTRIPPSVTAPLYCQEDYEKAVLNA